MKMENDDEDLMSVLRVVFSGRNYNPLRVLSGFLPHVGLYFLQKLWLRRFS